MNIEIKNRFNGEIIIVGEYTSIKEALGKNRGANLENANLRDANLYGVNLIDANLRGANLRGANLIDANLIDANLENANLIDANLRGANLIDANLRGANLIDANLRGANLENANLRDANLRGANLENANLRDAKGITLPFITITGSSHSVWFSGDILKIGCHEHSPKYWMENYKEIGESEDYTEEQITEYGNYIKMIVNLNKKEDK